MYAMKVERHISHIYSMLIPSIHALVAWLAFTHVIVYSMSEISIIKSSILLLFSPIKFGDV